MLVAGVLLVAAEPWRPAATSVTNGLLLLFAGAVMAMGLVPLLPGSWRRSLVRRRAPAAAVPHVVHVAPEFLAVEEGGVERRFGWASVQRLRIAFDLVVIDVPGRRVVLPQRVFTTDEQRTAVLGHLREQRRAARALPRRRTSDPFAPPRRGHPR